MKSFFRRLLCVISAAVMTAVLCTVTVSAASPKLNKSKVNLPIDYAVTLKASGTTKDLQWSVVNTSVAEIMSSDGKSAKIVGKSTGSTYVHAKAKGIDLKCRIIVKKSFITANKDNVTLEKGQSQKVTITVKGSKDIAVKNSDKSVCSVSWGKWDGNKITLTVKAKKNGTAQIKVYAKKFTNLTAETINVSVGGGSDKKSGSASDEVIDIVNSERSAQRVSSLKSDDTLNKIAEQRAREIAVKFSHTRPDGTKCSSLLQENDIVNVYAGENIAAGHRSAEEVMKTWMNSDGHRKNILNENYTRIGVGVYEASDGNTYWVQVFTSEF
ncbi:MAG: CAP domain-containing protein [Oscillospiraceae bacterium]|nr:CAP domain-containing protein [Oscillospiraceae bacterium]